MSAELSADRFVGEESQWDIGETEVIEILQSALSTQDCSTQD